MSYFRIRHKILKDIRDGRKISKIKAKTRYMHQCKTCRSYHSYHELQELHFICKKCGSYFPMPALERGRRILDEDYETFPCELTFKNPLEMPDYDRKYLEAHMETGLNEAVVAFQGKIHGYSTYLLVMDPYFLMGSLGKNTGKIISDTFDRASKDRLPLILFAASGGARMQEGIFSLMQMANTTFSQLKHGKENLFVSVYTDPTMGGVPASFAGLGDITLVEKGARVGFSGPRVIEQTIGEKLPSGFQRDEFLLDHGMVDDVVERKDFRPYLAKILEYHRRP